ncbi:hypothetical protein YC2023_110808 [Brassica napus]
MRGHMLSSSTTKEHVSRGRLITTASHHRRRSRLWISRPNRNSKAPPIFTANIFGLLISERIDRFGEISSTTTRGRNPATQSCDSFHPSETRADDGRTKEASPPRRQKTGGDGSVRASVSQK